MDTIKAIILPVIISIIGHAALISVTGMIDLRGDVRAAEVFSVDIKEPEPEKTAPQEEKKENKKNNPVREAKTVKDPGWREETVDLGSIDARYAPYLAGIKRKIMQTWKYPGKSYEKNEEGIAVVIMAIDANGSVAGTSLITSSGFPLLDEEAVTAISRASPFAPLPESYNLSRLNVKASFNYTIRE